jgi:DnaJ-class molecular chaperone
MKIYILDTCPRCKGKAYIPIGEAEDCKGENYIRHIPCSRCDGSGLAPQWVALKEFIELLQHTPCPHQHTSLQGKIVFTEGDVWDDITEICHDCGAHLD